MSDLALPNNTFDRTAGSHSLAAAGQRERYTKPMTTSRRLPSRGWLLVVIVAAVLHFVEANAQGTRIDEVPMYGGIDRSADPTLRAADADFIAKVSRQFGSRERACREFLNRGLQFMLRHELGMAMRRINQAWLLDPSNPEVYFGFASVLYEQRKHCDAVTMTEKAFATGQIRELFLPDTALFYTACATIDGSLDEHVKSSYLRRADELFVTAYASAGANKNTTLHFWAQSLYQRGDYAGAWAKVSEYRKVAGKEVNDTFLEMLRQKMPEPK